MYKPKVLILGPLPPPFMGPAIATEILINSSLSHDFDVYHINTSTHRSFETLGKFRVSGFIKNSTIFFQFIKILLISKPEIILIPISQTTLGFIKDSFFVFVSYLFKRKIIIQLRGSNWKIWLDSATWITNFFVKLTMNRANYGLVLGEKLKYIFEPYFPQNHIFSIPNGRNIKFFQRNNNDNNKIKLISVGNLKPEKGLKYILLAVNKLKQNNDFDFCIDIVGEWRDAKLKSECLKICKQKNLPVNFHHNTHGTKKFRLLTNSDIFIFTPYGTEGHPWVIVEAIAAGLPIITTDKGAITESVINDHNGFIIDEKSSTSISEKVEYLINNENLRSKMGYNSKMIHKEKFSEEIMIEKYKKLFFKINKLR